MGRVTLLGILRMPDDILDHALNGAIERSAFVSAAREAADEIERLDDELEATARAVQIRLDLSPAEVGMLRYAVGVASRDEAASQMLGRLRARLAELDPG